MRKQRSSSEEKVEDVNGFVFMKFVSRLFRSNWIKQCFLKSVYRTIAPSVFFRRLKKQYRSYRPTASFVY